ncbi:MAG: hypothetical protein M3209_09650 [Acidobacteriota bacterium]|nr:hypothetical protein [Acidobacteriota bacterium]
MTNPEILQDFLSEKCRCGEHKTTRQSFCRDCYFKLPQELKQRLYRDFGAGYEEAYRDALSFLEAQIIASYPVINASEAIVTAVESDDVDSEIWLCFYKSRADLEKPNRKDLRVGALKFARWKDVEVFFFLNGNLVNQLGKTSKFNKAKDV